MDLPTDSSRVAHSSSSKPDVPWFQRLSRPILFLIVTLMLVGGYLAFTIPVAVFPNTDFPRIVIGIDNGVMPIDQMLVVITRPVEEAVNSVPGLQKVQSITSRGSAEVDLFFDWTSDMILTLQRVDAVVARLQSELPPTAKIETHRLTSDTIPQNKLWEIATYDLKPRVNRLDGVASVLVQGGRIPEFQVMPEPARLLAAGITVNDILDAIRRTNLIDSPGLIENNHQLVLGLISGQVRTPEQLGQIVVKTSTAGVPIRLGDIANIAPSVAPVGPATFPVLAGHAGGAFDIERYMPADIHVRVGDTIEWTSQGIEGHTVTFVEQSQLNTLLSSYLLPDPADPARRSCGISAKASNPHAGIACRRKVQRSDCRR